MFGRGRKKSGDQAPRPLTSTAGPARTALRRTRFEATRVAGVPALEVDYDPARVLRGPAAGQDRTDWLESAVAAWCSDLGWDPAGEQATTLTGALGEVADAESSHDAQLLVVPETFPKVPPSLVEIDVLDEELMHLEHAAPEVWLSWRDLDPDAAVKVTTFPRGWRYSSQPLTPLSFESLLRMHKPLPEHGAHLVGTAFYYGGAQVGDCLATVSRAWVPER